MQRVHLPGPANVDLRDGIPILIGAIIQDLDDLNGRAAHLARREEARDEDIGNEPMESDESSDSSEEESDGGNIPSNEFNEEESDGDNVVNSVYRCVQTDFGSPSPQVTSDEEIESDGEIESDESSGSVEDKAFSYGSGEDESPGGNLVSEASGDDEPAGDNHVSDVDEPIRLHGVLVTDDEDENIEEDAYVILSYCCICNLH